MPAAKVRVERRFWPPHKDGSPRVWKVWYECGFCLAEISGGDRFCRMCGIELAAASERIETMRGDKVVVEES